MSLGVPNHASFSVSTDDGREIDMHGMFFAPHNLELYKAYYGSEEVARAELQGLWDEFASSRNLLLKPKPRTCSPDVQVHTLFDAYAATPSISPPGWKIHVVPGTLTPWTSLPVPPMMEMMSMEAAYGLQPHEIHPGEEKYIAQEGTRFSVVSPEGLVRFFELPIRQDIHITAGQALVFVSNGGGLRYLGIGGVGVTAIASLGHLNILESVTFPLFVLEETPGEVITKTLSALAALLGALFGLPPGSAELMCVSSVRLLVTPFSGGYCGLRPLCEIAWGKMRGTTPPPPLPSPLPLPRSFVLDIPRQNRGRRSIWLSTLRSAPRRRRWVESLDD
ncbi:hypothetical protein HYDPIDRAFT_29313 [Hydnomerulius pinastri MD-312]|uniref:Uncharacterized protein n=1 Tax=Hydnomerulius pinastri MD-312 TaxID=994086 RepID=A0A0C9WE07_9AGAM|nr:hypothetical protein HYDPIDRAFT_29313 [Hydnomerulius pinastri MD-312]